MKRMHESPRRHHSPYAYYEKEEQVDARYHMIHLVGIIQQGDMIFLMRTMKEEIGDMKMQRKGLGIEDMEMLKRMKGDIK